MQYQIDMQNKSTKEVILEYLKLNHGREIPVSEISKKFNFKLARISNAIKELELAKEINIESRPLIKGKYTVISLTGDSITNFASHEREVKGTTTEKEINTIISEEVPISNAIDILISPVYNQTKFENLLQPYYNNYFTLACDIIQPIMYEVGLLWQNGKITVGDEHIISSRVEKFVTKLIQAQSVGSNKLIVLAPSENEHHTLALNVLELLLIERGFRVINLSYTIDALSLISFIKKAKIYPDWIFFSLTMNSLVHILRMDIKVIRKELQMPNLKIVIGGQGKWGINPEEFKEVDKIIKTKKDIQDLLFSL